MVVDLGFVDDYNNAKILSWAAQSYMKSVVVENFDLSKKLYDRGVKSWAISGVIPYEIKNKVPITIATITILTYITMTFRSVLKVGLEMIMKGVLENSLVLLMVMKCQVVSKETLNT